MHQRDPSYSYDDQGATYTGHTSHPSGEYIPTDYQPYDGSNHYYAAPSHAAPSHTTDTNQPNPYTRSMTPSVAPTHRYPNPNPNRFFNSQGVAASSSNSSIVQPAYIPQKQYYDAPYITPEYRTQVSNHSHPRIPTPSEIAHSYSNYHHMTTPQSPIPDPCTSSADYPAPSQHMLPSSHSQGIHHVHRPRIVTGRPRTASAAGSTSPTSATSPSGERFPCDKCEKTFSRAHDRKRHQTQHSSFPISHSCKYCAKEFSRADSLKRHLDNGCDEMPTTLSS